jgi:hypothetical protein
MQIELDNLTAQERIDWEDSLKWYSDNGWAGDTHPAKPLMPHAGFPRHVSTPQLMPVRDRTLRVENA